MWKGPKVNNAVTVDRHLEPRNNNNLPSHKNAPKSQNYSSVTILCTSLLYMLHKELIGYTKCISRGLFISHAMCGSSEHWLFEDLDAVESRPFPLGHS